MYLAQQSSLYLGRIAVLYTLVFTNLIVTLYLAQQSSLYLGRIAVFYTPLFTILIVTLYLAQQSSLYLGRITVLYTLVFTNLIVTLYLAQQSSLYLGRIAVHLYTSVYKFNCNLVFSTAIQLVFRPDCSALYTRLFTNLIVTLYLAQQSSLYLGRITVLYTQQ